MSDYQYEQREAQEFWRAIQEVEKAPLAERKEAARDFARAMREDPALVGERINWLLAGNYGYGAMQAAKRVLTMQGRANKAWHLNTMIAALEWRCPGRMASAEWKKLSPAEKKALDEEIRDAIRSSQEE